MSLTRRAFLQVIAMSTAAAAGAVPLVPAPTAGFMSGAQAARQHGLHGKVVTVHLRPCSALETPMETARLPPTHTVVAAADDAVPAMKHGDPWMPRPCSVVDLQPGDGVVLHPVRVGDPIILERVLVVCQVDG